MEEAADTDIMEDMYRRYENLTDEEILLDIKEHNNKVALDYLINKYRNFVRAKARSYFLIGADREDIVQEGIRTGKTGQKAGEGLYQWTEDSLADFRVRLQEPFLKSVENWTARK